MLNAKFYNMEDLFVRILKLLCTLPSIFIATSYASTTTDVTAFAQQQAAGMPAQIAPYAQDIKALAQQSYQAMQSPKLQADIKNIVSNASTVVPIQQSQNPETATPGDVLIFISLGMPDQSLQQWFEQASRIHAPLVIRGLVDDSFPATQQRIATLIGGDENKKIAVVLDPRLFVDYQITQVPAVVVRNRSLQCLPTQSCPTIYPYDVVYGDVPLDTALRTIARMQSL